MRIFWVYILSNRRRRLYVGVTGNLARRLSAHRGGGMPGFTRRYNITRLVYCEPHGRSELAIGREKQIKGWTRGRKVALIESVNPGWLDLVETLSLG
jgi:putative endonuclease